MRFQKICDACIVNGKKIYGPLRIGMRLWPREAPIQSNYCLNETSFLDTLYVL